MSNHDDDHLGRLRAIAEDGPVFQWVLDRNDVAAIRWAVAEIERLRSAQARRPVPYRGERGEVS